MKLLLYIDPGTGSLLMSILIGFTITIVFSLKNIFYKVISLFTGKKYKGTNNFSGELVFFNEGVKYWNVFRPVLDELERQNQKFVYLTADKDDPGLNINPKICNSYYLGDMNQALIALNKLRASMCVTTTPQLDIMVWKRSKYVKHYCYLHHSPVDIHSYKKFAFDYYDSVLCSSTYQMINLRQLERDRNSKKKLLLKTGYTYYDIKVKERTGNSEHILIAPTWGDKSFFPSKGDFLIQILLSKGHKVLYRPHPQSWISEKALLVSIMSKYEKNNLFEIDKRVDNGYALSNARLMIADNSSGVIHDVAFFYKIPIIAVDFTWDDGGYESSDIDEPASIKYLLDDVGKTISGADISNINIVIEEVSKVKISRKIIDKHVFNYQRSGPVAAEQIMSLLEGVNSVSNRNPKQYI
jgi:hypothetical protein